MMTKKEAIAEFNSYILPEVRRQYGRGDYVAIAEAWNNYTDMLRSDGRISRHQYNTWGGHPADRRGNPIGAGAGIIIGAAIVGGILLLLRKPAKAEEKTSEPAPTLGPPPLQPGPSTTTPPAGPAAPSTAWLTWDGCFRPGKTYRLCSKVAQEPGPAAIQYALAELKKMGLDNGAGTYSAEDSTFCVKATWTLPEQCGSASAALLPPGTTIQTLSGA